MAKYLATATTKGLRRGEEVDTTADDPRVKAGWLVPKGGQKASAAPKVEEPKVEEPKAEEAPAEEPKSSRRRRESSSDDSAESSDS